MVVVVVNAVSSPGGGGGRSTATLFIHATTKIFVRMMITLSSRGGRGGRSILLLSHWTFTAPTSRSSGSRTTFRSPLLASAVDTTASRSTLGFFFFPWPRWYGLEKNFSPFTVRTGHDLVVRCSFKNVATRLAVISCCFE